MSNEVRAEKRCELCGAMIEGVEPCADDYREAMVGFISWLTHLYAHNGKYARMLAQMLIYPDDSISKCAQRIGVSRQRAGQIVGEMEKLFPFLAGVFNGRRPAVVAQRRRRSREAK
jgi:hypothetical protein